MGLNTQRSINITKMVSSRYNSSGKTRYVVLSLYDGPLP